MVLRLPDSCSDWNLELLAFYERGKSKYSEKNLSEQRREPTTNSHSYGVDAKFEPGSHWWEASALTTALPESNISYLQYKIKFKLFCLIFI